MNVHADSRSNRGGGEPQVCRTEKLWRWVKALEECLGSVARRKATSWPYIIAGVGLLAAWRLPHRVELRRHPQLPRTRLAAVDRAQASACSQPTGTPGAPSAPL